MTKGRIAARAVALAAAMTLAAAAWGAPPPGKGPHKGGESAEPGGAVAEVTFSLGERETITRYFQQHREPARRLPPGIAKNLARGKPLPPGIAKKFLPQELDASLPPRPGFERIVVGTDVLLIDAATRVIADILHNVLR